MTICQTRQKISKMEKKKEKNKKGLSEAMV